MKRIISTIVLLSLLASCSHERKAEQVEADEYDEQEYSLDAQSYNDVCYYFENELDEDVDDIEFDDNSGMYSVHTSSGLTYTIMNLGGGMYTIYDSYGNNITSMDLGGGMQVVHDNYGNSYNTMDLGEECP